MKNKWANLNDANCKHDFLQILWMLMLDNVTIAELYRLRCIRPIYHRGRCSSAAVQRHGAHLAIWGEGDVQLFRKYAKFAPKLVTLTAFISISKDTGCLGDPRWRWSSVSYCGLSHVACSAALLVTSVKEILSRRLMIMVAQYIWYHNTVRCSWSWQPVMLI